MTCSSQKEGDESPQDRRGDERPGDARQFALAPSELIFLNGERYAREVCDDSPAVSLLHVNRRVSSHELARRVIAAAILANEQAGNISLCALTHRSLLGLRRARRVLVEPGRADRKFPLYSLEAFIPEIIRRGAVEASELVFRLLREDAAESHRWAIDLVQGGLAARGIVEVEEVRHKGFVTQSHFRLAESTAKLVGLQPLEAINDLLRNAASARPEVYILLEEQIKEGLKKRAIAQGVDT
jgi:hypothetical protein